MAIGYQIRDQLVKAGNKGRCAQIESPRNCGEEDECLKHMLGENTCISGSQEESYWTEIHVSRPSSAESFAPCYPSIKINTASLSANMRASLDTTMANYKLSGAHCVAIL
jgi:hypothetical protein